MAKKLIKLTNIVLLMTLTACGTTMANKYDWKATESAPKNFPMEIVKGYFYSSDGYSLYVPNKKTIHHGWGNSISSHLVGPDLKSLPNRLDITFFSYTEDKFYKGDFDLPYDEILKLFSEGYFSPKEGDHTTFFEIIAGVAPGGTVTVWLSGIDKTTEIFSGRAEKTIIDWKNIVDNPEISREKFIEIEIEDSMTAEAMDVLKKNGVPISLWNTYRKRYDWQPLFSGQEPPGLIELIKFFNGEEGYLNYPLDESFLTEDHAIPKELHFIWDWPKGRPLSFELYFDEEEIFSAFEQLSKSNQRIYLELLMDGVEEGNRLWIKLRNDDEEVLLNNTKLETYGV